MSLVFENVWFINFMYWILLFPVDWIGTKSKFREFIVLISTTNKMVFNKFTKLFQSWLKWDWWFSKKAWVKTKKNPAVLNILGSLFFIFIVFWIIIVDHIFFSFPKSLELDSFFYFIFSMIIYIFKQKGLDAI